MALCRTLTVRDKPVFSMSQIAWQCLGLPPCLRLWGLLPGLVVAPWALTLPSSSVSEAKTVFTEGSADFLGNFPESRWTTAFPDAGCSTEFVILVFAYRVQEINSVIRETRAPPPQPWAQHGHFLCPSLASGQSPLACNC